MLVCFSFAGQPLSAEDHSAQFGRVDPLVAAVTRTMGAQGVKPLSLELRDEVGGSAIFWEAASCTQSLCVEVGSEVEAGCGFVKAAVAGAQG